MVIMYIYIEGPLNYPEFQSYGPYSVVHMEYSAG